MNVTQTVIDRLHETTRSAAADAESAAALREGRLLREPEAPSLDDLLGSMPQTSDAPRRVAPRQRDRKAEGRELRERIAAAESEASRARSEAREASDTARAAEREWKRAEKAAEQAQRRSDGSAERLRDLRKRLEDLR
jgi:chromosome segregation ATPase